MPCFFVILRETLNALDGPDLKDAMAAIATLFLLLGIGSGLASCTSTICFSAAAGSIVSKINASFVAAVLRNDVTWHEQTPTTVLQVRLEAPVLAASQLNFRSEPSRT